MTFQEKMKLAKSHPAFEEIFIRVDPYHPMGETAWEACQRLGIPEDERWALIAEALEHFINKAAHGNRHDSL